MDKSIITVNIFGSDYTIKGVAETDYMLKIAAYLNEKMNEIHDATGIKDPKRIAILASINICDELFEARKNLKDPVIDTYSLGLAHMKRRRWGEELGFVLIGKK